MTKRKMDGQTEMQKGGGRADGRQIEKQTERQTDKQMDRQMLNGRQTDR